MTSNKQRGPVQDAETPGCHACNATDGFVQMRLQDMIRYDVEATYPYSQCTNCGLIFQSPLLPKAELWAAYQSDYYSYADGPLSFFARLREMIIRYNISGEMPDRPLNRILTRLLHRRFSNLVPEYRGDGQKTFMDVGCGSGSNLKLPRHYGWKVCGTEISKDVVDMLSKDGFQMWSGGIEEVPSSMHGKVDALRLWHVLEHLRDPNEGLAKCHDLLADNGVIYGAVPNGRSLHRWLFGKFWVGYDAPRHTLVFNPRNLRMMLERNALGNVKVQYRASNSFLDSLSIYLANRRQKKTYLLNDRFLMSVFYLFDWICDICRVGDVIFFQAERVSRKTSSIKNNA